MSLAHQQRAGSWQYRGLLAHYEKELNAYGDSPTCEEASRAVLLHLKVRLASCALTEPPLWICIDFLQRSGVFAGSDGFDEASHGCQVDFDHSIMAKLEKDSRARSRCKLKSPLQPYLSRDPSDVVSVKREPVSVDYRTSIKVEPDQGQTQIKLEPFEPRRHDPVKRAKHSW